jgi:hypothetical protein
MANAHVLQRQNPTLAVKPVALVMMAWAVITAGTITAQGLSIPDVQLLAGSVSAPAAQDKVSGDCARQVWPYYSGSCLRRVDGNIRTVRVIPIDRILRSDAPVPAAK